MSIFDEGSLLSRLNRNETDSVDEHIVRNWTLAREIGALSGGRYDVTVKPLVDAWGFAGRERTAAPNLDSLLEFVGSDKVSVRDGRLVKSDPRVQLDFNSVAKGYTVDRVALLLEEYGAENYLVDIGGEVRCRGVNPHGDPWRIGIERPVDGIAYGQTSEVRVALSGGSLATSGNYRRFSSTPRETRSPTRSTPARAGASFRACFRLRWWPTTVPSRCAGDHVHGTRGRGGSAMGRSTSRGEGALHSGRRWRGVPKPMSRRPCEI